MSRLLVSEYIVSLRNFSCQLLCESVAVKFCHLHLSCGNYGYMYVNYSSLSSRACSSCFHQAIDNFTSMQRYLFDLKKAEFQQQVRATKSFPKDNVNKNKRSLVLSLKLPILSVL